MSVEAGTAVCTTRPSRVYVENDAGLKAAALDDMDSYRLDGLQKQFVHGPRSLRVAQRRAVGVMRPPGGRAARTWSARFYERIGDHAVNIGERVRYMVDGWMPEHAGAARASMRHTVVHIDGSTDAPADDDEGHDSV